MRGKQGRIVGKIRNLGAAGRGVLGLHVIISLIVQVVIEQRRTVIWIIFIRYRVAVLPKTSRIQLLSGRKYGILVFISNGYILIFDKWETV